MIEALNKELIMSARYSLLVIIVVALLLTINSLWLYKAGSTSCSDCGNAQNVINLDVALANPVAIAQD